MSEIKFYELKCKRCGGQLEQNGAIYKCESCGKTFEKQVVTDVADQLRAVLNEQKQEAVANHRRQLWAEMHEENTNSEKVRSLARDIKKYLPEDYFANFCEIANSEVENNSKQINAFLNNTPQSALEDYADVVLDFMIKSLRTENITAIAQFIERAFKGKDNDEKGRDNDESYDKYTTWLESEADKIDKGIYDLDIPRDVFLAYSSADMDKVLEICEYLESNDISCFMALRNLRHGRNAIHNYDQALKTAIENCKTVVFVSSTNSRNRKCDAFTKELPYIRQKDLEVAPARFRHDYEKLPAEYMMPRVEYVIEGYRGNVAEEKVREFFHGLEWCNSKEAVAKRVLDYLTAAPETTEETEEDIPAVEIPVKEDKSVKYCKKCGAKNRLTAKFCSKCEGTEFAATYDEYIASKIKYCANCGTECDSEANVCDNCRSKMFVPTKKAYEDLKALDAEDKRQQQIREQQEKEAERKRQEDAERKRREEELKQEREKERLRKLREEQERLRRQEEERQKKIREEEERKRKEEEERLRKLREEQERLRREEEERKCREAEEEERKRREEAERLRKLREEQERLRREEEERKRREEEEERKRREAFYIHNGVLIKYKGGSGDVVIPEGVTSIYGFAFRDCTSLTSIFIPDSVTSIGESTFNGCKSLKSINIPNGITSIGKQAFYNCTSLTSIFIPDSVTSIGESTFNGCKSLTSINVSSGNKTYKSIGGNLYSIDGKILLQYAVGKTAISFTIPESVTSIIKGAFFDCESLESITIPNGISSIGDYAFEGCKSLKSINIPNGITSIGESTFGVCKSLTSIIIPPSVTSIGEYAFSVCKSLTSIIIPPSVTSMGQSAFWWCDNLKTIYCCVKKPIFGLPEGWNMYWLGKGEDKCKAKVIWNYKG